jgi:tRNA A37 threonylcarbamoyladenosine synthetase subunit TsaC/SUA5/YrdC
VSRRTSQKNVSEPYLGRCTKPPVSQEAARVAAREQARFIRENLGTHVTQESAGTTKQSSLATAQDYTASLTAKVRAKNKAKEESESAIYRLLTHRPCRWLRPLDARLERFDERPSSKDEKYALGEEGVRAEV